MAARMIKHRVGIGALTIVLWLVAAGCAAPASPSGSARPATATNPATVGAGNTSAPAEAASNAAARPLDVLKVVDSRSLTSAPVNIAMDKGYFEAQGIEIQLEGMAGGADVVPFLATGDLDINVGAISVGLYNAFDRGADIKIIAPAGVLPLQSSPLPLLVRKDLWESGAVRTPADLKGRRVAVNVRGESVEYALTKVLDGVGLTVNDVDQVTLPFPDMPAALANGSVDAAIPAEPAATRALNLGVGVPMVVEIVPGKMTTALIASGKLLRERPDVVRRFMVAYMQGVRDIQPPALGVSDPARFLAPENIAIFQKYTGASEQVLRDQVPYTFDPDLVIQLDSIEDQQQVHIRNGTLTLARPVPVERMVDDTFVRHAQEVLGRVRS